MRLLNGTIEKDGRFFVASYSSIQYTKYSYLFNLLFALAKITTSNQTYTEFSFLTYDPDSLNITG